MKYNKLVRDYIPEIICKNGEQPVTIVANNQEYWIKLQEKLIEEVNEFLESEKPEELADVLEVVSAICEFKKIDKGYLENLRLQKKQERGGFVGRIILLETRK